MSRKILAKKLAGNRAAVAFVLADAALRTKLYKEAKFWYLNRQKNKRVKKMPYKRRGRSTYRKRRKFRNRRKLATRGYVNRKMMVAAEKGASYKTTDLPDMQFSQLYSQVVGEEIEKGTNYGNRIGKSIRIKGLMFNIMAKNLSSAASSNVFIRFMVLWDKKPNGLGTGNAMWKSSDGSGFENKPDDFNTTGGKIQQIINDLNTSKYKTLYNKVFKLAPLNNAQSKPSMIVRRLWVPMYLRGLTFNADEAAVYAAYVPYIKVVWFAMREDEASTVTDQLEMKVDKWTHFMG